MFNSDAGRSTVTAHFEKSLLTCGLDGELMLLSDTQETRNLPNTPKIMSEHFNRQRDWLDVGFLAALVFV